jgi:alpha-tubulin suppressor-like RCC1 family protein
MKRSKCFVLMLVVIFTVGILTVNCGITSNAADNAVFTKVVGSVGLKEDGSLWSVSIDGNSVSKMADGYSDIDVDSLESSYIGLKKDGTVWVWGKNNMGQFAQSKLSESDKPIKIMDNVKAISGLSALKKDGSVWIWGGSRFFDMESKVNKPMFLYNGVKSIAYGSNCIYVIDNKDTLYGLRNYYSINGLGYDSNKVQISKIKIADNVKSVSNNHYITKDNNLWQITFNENDIVEGQIIYENYNISKKIILKDVIYTDSNNDSAYYLPKGTGCAIKKDGSLWVWGMDYLSYSQKGNVDVPQKIMGDVKYAKCGWRNIQIISKDGHYSVMGIKSPKSFYCIPKVAMKNVKAEFGNWVLTNDNVLWMLPDTTSGIGRFKMGDNVKTVLEDEIVEKTDGSRWKFTFVEELEKPCLIKYDFEYKLKCDTIYVKNDNTIWKDCIDENGERVYKKVDIKVDSIEKVYGNESRLFYINKDNTLFMLTDKSHNPSFGKMVEYSDPVKILDDVKDIELLVYYTFAITNSGELYGWYNNYENEGKPSIKKIMDNVESFDLKTEKFDVIKKDKSHWNLASQFLSIPGEFVEFEKAIRENAINDIKSMEGIQSYNGNLYIDKDGGLFVRGFENETSGRTGLYFKENYFGKVMDNVVYAEDDGAHGVAICKDGSLWEYGEVKMQESGKDAKVINADKRPRKLLENVKKAHAAFNSCTAILEDGSLYVWGNNDSGQLGTGSMDFIEKPRKIMGNVADVTIEPYELSILLEDGTLLKCGFKYNMQMPSAIYENPVRIWLPNGEKIVHNKCEAVGINEDINIQAKVDSEYTKDVKVILESGQEILLYECAGSYFVGSIPGLKKPGNLKYRIVASDDKGNRISSNEYNVQVISNDTILADLENGEFVVSKAEVIIDGKIMDSYEKTLIKDGRTLAPVRALSEGLKAEVNWDGKTKTVNISKGNKVINIKIGSREVNVNNQKIRIDVPAMIVDSRTMLPLRAICEMLDASVNWNDADNKIEVVSGN